MPPLVGTFVKLKDEPQVAELFDIAQGLRIVAGGEQFECGSGARYQTGLPWNGKLLLVRGVQYADRLQAQRGWHRLFWLGNLECLTIAGDAGLATRSLLQFDALGDQQAIAAWLSEAIGPCSEWRQQGQTLKCRAGEVPVTWLESSEPSYILYTSGTTGKPKGVQRDTGGYAVALAASMQYIYCGGEGETMFSTSDIGWVVGHSYIVYGPLIAGMCTIMYEGTPLRPDAGIWWKICQEQGVTVMFSAPTAIRVLKKQDPAFLKKYDLSKLRALYCAGEPMDETSHQWMMDELGIQVIDHYWQTETGWAMLSLMPGVEKQDVQLGSPGFPVYGYDVRLFRDDGSECGPNEKGIVGVVPPLPPGCLSTVWGDDKRFVSTYFTLFQEPLVYSSFDWGIKDDAGYYKILGRTDDVINVAGHRLGTREIEEAVQAHPAIAEVAERKATSAPQDGQASLNMRQADVRQRRAGTLNRSVFSGSRPSPSRSRPGSPGPCRAAP